MQEKSFLMIEKDRKVMPTRAFEFADEFCDRETFGKEMEEAEHKLKR